MNNQLVVLKRSPSQADASDDDVRQVVDDDDVDAEVDDNVVDRDIVSSPPSFMLLPLPLPLHLQHLTGKGRSKAANDCSQGRNVASSLSSSTSTSTSTSSTTRCVMNLVPSPLPPVDLMAALASLKAEFIQNCIVAMITRKVRPEVNPGNGRGCRESPLATKQPSTTLEPFFIFLSRPVGLLSRLVDE